MVGPSSLRIVLEVLQTGGSETVDRLVTESPKRADIERRRGLRQHFLSRAAVAVVLAGRARPGVVGPSDYRGDL